ncbi:hypothetical protein B0H11DRAFT_1957468 [Mycena galericulata]|nr:hypothetical protein B0H11DRAFT_1957468 [Mycena galericulata]
MYSIDTKHHDNCSPNQSHNSRTSAPWWMQALSQRRSRDRGRPAHVPHDVLRIRDILNSVHRALNDHTCNNSIHGQQCRGESSPTDKLLMLGRTFAFPRTPHQCCEVLSFFEVSLRKPSCSGRYWETCRQKSKRIGSLHSRAILLRSLVDILARSSS